MTPKLLKFDPRSKLVVLLIASFQLMLPYNQRVDWLLVLFILVLFYLQGAWKKGTIYFLVYVGLFVGEQLLLQQGQTGFWSFFSFLFVGNRKMLPVVMAGAWSMHQLKISEWVAALQKWRLPFSLIVALTVLFRFFPTLIQDFKSIRQAMKHRGIALSTGELFLHPGQTIEYILVPILMSAENTSTDLAAASLTRGLGNEQRHTSIYPLRLSIQDYLLMASMTFLVLGRFWL